MGLNLGPSRSEKCGLKVFVNRALGRIFGPIWDELNGYRTKLHDVEIYNSYFLSGVLTYGKPVRHIRRIQNLTLTLTSDLNPGLKSHLFLQNFQRNFCIHFSFSELINVSPSHSPLFNNYNNINYIILLCKLSESPF